MAVSAEAESRLLCIQLGLSVTLGFVKVSWLVKVDPIWLANGSQHSTWFWYLFLELGGIVKNEVPQVTIYGGSRDTDV